MSTFAAPPPTPSVTETIKVFVKLTDGTDFFGQVYVHNGDRVQDLLNDKRQFLPIQRHFHERGAGKDIWVTVCINKATIILIEER